jgi:TolA-binding protein
VTSWLALIASDPAAIVFLVAVVCLVVVLLGAGITRRTRWRREQQAPEPPAPEEPDAAALARWVAEGRRLFTLWQERVERVNELQSRLTAMAQEVARLQAQLGHMDALQADNLRLNQQAETLRLERDELRTVLARVGDLIERASKERPQP